VGLQPNYCSRWDAKIVAPMWDRKVNLKSYSPLKSLQHGILTSKTRDEALDCKIMLQGVASNIL